MGKITTSVSRIIRKNIGLILLSFIIYLIGIPTGFVYFDKSQSAVNPVLEEIKELIKYESKFQMAINIFLNNLTSSLILFLSGTLIIIPALILFINGFLLGFILRLFIQKNLSLYLLLAVLLPHSLPELLAICLSSGLGIRIGLSFICSKENRVINVNKAIREGCFIYIVIVIPLLLLAAFLEVYVSASFIQ